MGTEGYEIEYTRQFIEDMAAHNKSGQRPVLKKIDKLVDELREHPATGSGNPEQLKGDRKGQWSRRITKKHRLVYLVQEEKAVVLLLSAMGHYGDK